MSVTQRPRIAACTAVCFRTPPATAMRRLKPFRGFATRYDKLSTRYQAGIHLISTIIWLRTL